MYSVVLLSVLTATGHHPIGPGCSAVLPFYPITECCGFLNDAVGGLIAPYLYAGTPGPAIPAEDVRAWEAYLEELDVLDRTAMRETWSQADFAGRKTLIGLLAKLRGEQEKKKAAEAPLTEQEQEAWKAHLKGLKGDDLKKAEAEWNRADLAGRRRLLEAVKKSPPE
jgi:hypothetical protein